MSIFIENSKSPAQERYEAIQSYLPNLIKGDKNRCIDVFNKFWDGITFEEAQELFALLGTEAVQVFSFHSKWQELIKMVDPTYEILTPPFEISFKEDGSATPIEPEVVDNPVEESIPDEEPVV